MREAQMGELTVRIAGGSDRNGGGDGPLVILLHGFGAPGEDLVPLWRVLDVPASTRFLFPAAPLSLAMGYGDSRAWWMIDPAYFEDLQKGAAQAPDRSNDVPEGLAEAREKVIALLDCARESLSAETIVLGGFSQGAMLSLDVALHWEGPLAGLILLSGTLLARKEWEPRLASRSGLRVLQSHGTSDPLLSFSQAEKLRDLLTSSNLPVEFLPFRGGHTIPESVLTRAGAFITSVTTTGTTAGTTGVTKPAG